MLPLLVDYLPSQAQRPEVDEGQKREGGFRQEDSASDVLVHSLIVPASRRRGDVHS